MDVRKDITSPLFRVLSVTDTFDFERGLYTTDYEVEYHDEAWAWSAWWDPSMFS